MYNWLYECHILFTKSILYLEQCLYPKPGRKPNFGNVTTYFPSPLLNAFDALRSQLWNWNALLVDFMVMWMLLLCSLIYHFSCPASASRTCQRTAEHSLGGKGGPESGFHESLTTDGSVDEFAKIIITLSTEFLLRVYLRMHGNLREELPLWKVLCNIFMIVPKGLSHVTSN